LASRGEERLIALAIGARERGDQQLRGAPHLQPELPGHVGLGLHRLGEERLETILRAGGEEPLGAEERREAVE